MSTLNIYPNWAYFVLIFVIVTIDAHDHAGSPADRSGREAKSALSGGIPTAKKAQANCSAH
jgi:hypothetical protein